MYQKIYAKGKLRHKAKNIFLIVAMALVLAATVGGTLSYLVAQDDSIENVFQASRVSCKVEETFANNMKSDVSVKNTGDVDAFIRAAVVVNWVDTEGNVFAAKPKTDGYTLEFAENSKWYEGNDGYFYYTSAVAPDENTGLLIESCQVISENTPEGYYLSVEILSSAVQASPDRVVGEVWSNDEVTVTASDGTLTVTNK